MTDRDEIQRISDRVVEMEINLDKLVIFNEAQIAINANVIESLANIDEALKATNKSILSLLDQIKALS